MNHVHWDVPTAKVQRARQSVRRSISGDLAGPSALMHWWPGSLGQKTVRVYARMPWRQKIWGLCWREENKYDSQCVFRKEFKNQCEVFLICVPSIPRTFFLLDSLNVFFVLFCFWLTDDTWRSFFSIRKWKAFLCVWTPWMWIRFAVLTQRSWFYSQLHQASHWSSLDLILSSKKTQGVWNRPSFAALAT